MMDVEENCMQQKPDVDPMEFLEDIDSVLGSSLLR